YLERDIENMPGSVWGVSGDVVAFRPWFLGIDAAVALAITAAAGALWERSVRRRGPFSIRATLFRRQYSLSMLLAFTTWCRWCCTSARTDCAWNGLAAWWRAYMAISPGRQTCHIA